MTLVGASLVGGSILELLAQEVARRSIVDKLTGWEPSAWLVAAFCVVVTALLAPAIHARTAMLFAALFSVGLAAQLSLGARLQSDGFYYFVYPRSIAFDGDVNFSNDYRLLGLTDKPHLFQPTRTGHAQSAATVGPTFLWAPFFAVGHVVAKTLSARDPTISTDGSSYPYRQAICVAGLFYGLLGCWFMFRFCIQFFDAGLAAASVAILITGSFMLWYFVKEPTMTHAPSMALVAGFAWAWAATREQRSVRQWAALGLLAGFMTTVRWQNALFAVLPALDALRALVRAARHSDRQLVRQTLLNGLLFTVAAVVAFTPQMIAWNAIYGSPLSVSPLGPEIRLTNPHIADILWSSRNGLLSTSPVLFISALGLMALAWRRPSIGWPALLTVALMTYFNASIQDWGGSSSYGGRRFDGTVSFFCLGLAQTLSSSLAFVRRRPGVALSAAGVVLVLWNLTLMSATQSGAVRIGEPASFGDVMAAQARVFHGWFGNPFTYPASLAFAVRNRLSPGRYDLLSVNRFLGDPLRPYGRIDIGGDDGWLIGEGWHQPEQEGTVSFRWATGNASVFVPLDHADDLRVQVRLHAFGYPRAPDQSLTVIVNGHSHGPVSIASDWNTAEVLTRRGIWHAGVNRLTLTFAWDRRPADVGLGGDVRPLAAAVDYIRVAVPERSAAR